MKIFQNLRKASAAYSRRLMTVKQGAQKEASKPNVVK